MNPKSLRVIVVGGGVVGCAVAFTLARSGVRVTLIEPDPFGAHASGKNPGNLNPLLHTPPALVPLALESFRRHMALAEELSALGCRGYDLAPVRRILLAFDAARRRELEEIARGFENRKGFSARLLDPKAVLDLEPRIAIDLQAGLLVLGNMSVDSRALTHALAEGASRHGAKIVPMRVGGLDTVSGRVAAVRVGRDSISCDAVVLATGPWVSETKEWLGLSLPVEPIKGQMLRMKLPGEAPRHDISHGIISLYRRGGDEIGVGVTKEGVGLDEASTEAGRAHLIAGAVRIFPDMAGAVLLEHLTALRPQGPSGFPIVGKAPEWENVYVANGGGIKGVLLCTGIGQAIRDLLLEGASRMPLTLLSA
jgi:glycine oxidase